jgi:hypothetical protein
MKSVVPKSDILKHQLFVITNLFFNNHEVRLRTVIGHADHFFFAFEFNEYRRRTEDPLLNDSHIIGAFPNCNLHKVSLGKLSVGQPLSAAGYSCTFLLSKWMFNSSKSEYPPASALALSVRSTSFHFDPCGFKIPGLFGVSQSSKLFFFYPHARGFGKFFGYFNKAGHHEMRHAGD